MARVLIAGCGYVGSALAQRLVADGDRVFALRRRTEGLPQAFQPIAADLCDPNSLMDLPPVEVLVYTPQEWDSMLASGGSFARSVQREGRVLYERETEPQRGAAVAQRVHCRQVRATERALPESGRTHEDSGRKVRGF